MPTGYTAEIKKGISFKKFALSCARAFGALSEMRDEPWDAKIPDEIKVDDYHLKIVNSDKKELEKLSKLSRSEIEKACEKVFQQSVKDWNEANKEKLDLLAKYNLKLAEAKAWTPPTENHKGLKDFMIQQITDSIKWDCDMTPKPVKSTVEEYIESKKETLIWGIEYHTEAHAKAVKIAESRTAWIRELKNSL
jgi:hypothetical protein